MTIIYAIYGTHTENMRQGSTLHTDFLHWDRLWCAAEGSPFVGSRGESRSEGERMCEAGEEYTGEWKGIMLIIRV